MRFLRNYTKLQDVRQLIEHPAIKKRLDDISSQEDLRQQIKKMGQSKFPSFNTEGEYVQRVRIKLTRGAVSKVTVDLEAIE